MPRCSYLLPLVFLVSIAGFADEAEDVWSGTAGFSLLATTGNSDTETVGLNFNMERIPEPWGLELTATFLRAEDNGAKTAERYRVGIRGKRAIGERIEAIAGFAVERDRFAGINQRMILEAGASYKSLLGPTHTLSFDGGVTYTDEEGYVPTLVDEVPVILQPSSDYIGAFLGLDWDWQLSENTSLVQRLVFLPNFDESDDWRYTSDTGLQVQMSERLALKVSYQLRYDNLPAPGFEDTDTATTISLVVGL